MMYILGYLRKHFLQYKYTAVQTFGISKVFLKKCLMLIKAVAYLFDFFLYIIPQNNIVKYY